MAVTIRELSQVCGVSVSSVSKALNGYKDISPATREAVEKAARELGYYPNSNARALKNKRTYNLGVLFADDEAFGLTHGFFSMVLESFKRVAEALGYDITFISHNIGKSHMTYLEHCLYRKLDGACLACINFKNPEVMELAASKLPFIAIDHPYEGRSCIVSDNEGGMRILMNYIYSRGHRRVAYIHGAPSAVTEARLRSFQRFAKEAQMYLPREYLREGRYNSHSVTLAHAQALLNLENPPTCILAPDDYAAMGIMEAAALAGKRIPEDLSIAGYDGIRISQLLSPRLTTIRQDTESLGREAAERLVRSIEEPGNSKPVTVMVPCSLIEGETVASV